MNESPGLFEMPTADQFEDPSGLWEQIMSRESIAQSQPISDLNLLALHSVVRKTLQTVPEGGIAQMLRTIEENISFLVQKLPLEGRESLIENRKYLRRFFELFLMVTKGHRIDG